MKKTLLLLCLFITFLACSNNDDDTTVMPIQNLQMPSSETSFSESQAVTIHGVGFTQNSQIWLRNIQAKANGDIQAEVTKVDNNSIVFKVPANTTGKKEVILKQDGNEYLLGILTFKEKYRYYTFCYDSDKNELAEIDIETGNLIWNDFKIPNYGSNSRGEVFNESGDELITWGFNGGDTLIINRLNMTTKEVKTFKAKNTKGLGNFNDIVKLNNKYYTFCYDSGKNELAEIDIETGNLIWNDFKIPNYGSNSRGEVFNESGDELITWGFNGGDAPIINRLNMTTKEVKTFKAKNTKGSGHFNDIVKLNNKYYTFCYGSDKNELVEIDIETGNLIWNDFKIPNYGSNSRGEVFNESGDELITWGFNGGDAPIMNRLDMITKEVKTIEVKNLNGAQNLNNIIVRK